MWSDELNELDDEFREQMNVLGERQQTDWTHKSRLFARVCWLSKTFWCYLGTFCQVDLYGGLQTDTPNKWKWKHREHFDSRYSSANKMKWWPCVSLTVCLYSMTRILINMFYQYLFDFDFLRNEILKTLTSRPPEIDLSTQLKSNFESPFVQYVKLSVAAAQNASSLDRALKLSISSSLDGFAYANLPELSQQLEARVQAARAHLKAIGAPYINLHFVIQVTYYFLISGAFVLVICIQIFHTYFKPFNYGLTRAFLDLKHERRLHNSLIVDVMNRFIASSRTFTRLSIEQIQLYGKRQIMSDNLHRLCRLQIQPSIHTEVATLSLNHSLLIKQLKRLALNGLLRPNYRTAKWVDSASILTMLLNLLMMLYAFIGTLYFAFIFFALNEELDIQLSPVDILVISEAGVLLSLIIPIGIFFISQIVANCIDQIFYSLEISQLIIRAIRTNQMKFRGLVQAQQETQGDVTDGDSDLNEQHANVSPFSRPCCKLCGHQLQHSKLDRKSLNSSKMTPYFPYTLLPGRGRYFSSPAAHTLKEIQQGPDDVGADSGGTTLSEAMQGERQSIMSRTLAEDSFRTQMNGELLRSFMHYKIFVAQVKPITKSFGDFASCLMVLMIFFPINVRLHSPYFNQSTKMYSMLLNLLFTSICNLCFVPMCYMHSRCLALYKHLSSLIAHVIEVSAYQRQQHLALGPARSALGGQQIYDAHTVWLLRKELNHPQQLAGQFAIVSSFMRLNYNNLLRIHFWVGIITLSMVVDASTSQEFLGRLFNDPFGVFDWPPAAVGFIRTLRNAQ